MKIKKTKRQTPRVDVKALVPRDERAVKAGSINFTKISFNYTPMNEK